MAEQRLLDEASRVSRLEAQVESIKEDVAELKTDVRDLHSRITTGNREIMDKIDEMDKRLDEKLNANSALAKKQHEEIQNELQKDIVKITDRVDILERWRWMIVGGAIVVGYIIGHMDFFKKFVE